MLKLVDSKSENAVVLAERFDKLKDSEVTEDRSDVEAVMLP